MSWTDRSLDELGTISRGRSRHRPRDAAHLYGGDYPFVQTGDVKHAGLYLTKYEQTYSEAGLAQSKLWPEGTLCITIAANIADTSILKIPACFPDSVIGFIPEEGKSDARFVKYLFDAMLKRKYKAFTQGAAQDNLSQEKLLSLKFPVPDISTQKEIADVLATYDELIENNKRRIELLEESARQLYKEWFVRFRFPGHEHIKIIDSVPDGWEKKSISALCSFLGRGMTPSYDDEGKYIVINQKCIRNRLLSIDLARRQSKDFSDEKLVQKGDVLINSTGTGTLGRVAQCWIHLENYTVDTHVTIARPKADVPAFWFGYCLLELETIFEGMGEGATNQKELKRDLVGALQVLVPPKIMRQEFDDFVCSLIGQISNLMDQNRSLISARDILLPKLMSGEIAV